MTPGHSDAYLAAAAARRYTVKCNHTIGRRRVDRVIATGLPWQEARALAERLQARARAKPKWSNWTGRLYGPQLEA